MIERERKWLITQPPPGLSRFPHKLIEQGYLVIATRQHPIEVRVRRSGTHYVLTVKQGGKLSRLEIEVPIPSRSAKMLWPLTKGKRVMKMRYKIPYQGLTIELDEYRAHARGLHTAEVEFDSAAAMRRFSPPNWFDREITGRKRYSNTRLAMKGWNPGKKK